MKIPLFIMLAALVLGAGTAFAILNHACKSGHHAWRASNPGVRHHVRAGHR